MVLTYFIRYFDDFTSPDYPRSGFKATHEYVLPGLFRFLPATKPCLFFTCTTCPQLACWRAYRFRWSRKCVKWVSKRACATVEGSSSPPDPPKSLRRSTSSFCRLYCSSLFLLSLTSIPPKPRSPLQTLISPEVSAFTLETPPALSQHLVGDGPCAVWFLCACPGKVHLEQEKVVCKEGDVLTPEQCRLLVRFSEI